MQPRLHPPQRGIAVWGPPVFLCLLAVLLLIGIWNHMVRTREEQQFEQEKRAGGGERAGECIRADKAIDLVLPGSIQAFQSTTLYARSNGFLGKWLVDIGDHVTKGQTLAEIETPDLDQQLRQSQGNLDQAKANFEIARLTAVAGRTFSSRRWSPRRITTSSRHPIRRLPRHSPRRRRM